LTGDKERASFQLMPGHARSTGHNQENEMLIKERIKIKIQEILIFILFNFNKKEN